MPCPRRCLLLLVAALLPAATVLSAAPFQCSVRAVSAPWMRLEGMAEPVGDVLLTCTGGTRPAAGAALPVTQLKLQFSPRLTVVSRVLDAATQITEAMALIGEPSPVKQTICQTPLAPAGCPAAATVFPGQLTAPHELTWNLPLAAPGDTGTVTVRLTNLRLNAAQTVATAVQAIVTAAGTEAPAISGGGTALVGTVTRSLATTVELSAMNTGSASTCSTTAVNVRLAETNAANAWRRRTVALPLNNVVSAPAAQSILDFPNDSETIFYNPQFPGMYKAAGLADHGTRLYLRFTNVPAGVRLYTPSVVATTRGAGVTDGALRRTGTDAAGAGLFSAQAPDSRGLIEMAAQNGGRQAVFEVLNSRVADLNSATIPVTVSYTGTAAVSLKGLRLETGYAPFGESLTTAPRFSSASLDGAKDIPGLDACPASSPSPGGGSGGNNNTTPGVAGATSPGLYFMPVPPCRVLDTRDDGPGRLGRPSLEAAILRTLPLAGTHCKLPSDARAFSLNFTVVPKGPLGYITTWPAGASQPFASTLNAIDGRVKANAAIVPAGAGNSGITAMATEATDLVVDVNGYFVDAAANSRALAFYALPPCRIADTRNTAGPLGGPGIAAGGTKTIPVLSANCGVPASAQAYSLNATVVPKGPLGYLTLWPAGEAQPVVSTLNSPKGEIVANAAIVPAGTNGSINAFAQGETHLVLDINGYFAPPGAAGALRYFTVNPCRLADTREPSPNRLAGNETRTFAPLATGCGLASTAAAYALNATVVPQAGLGYLTMWPAGSAQPFVSTLNVITDPVVANAAIVPAGTGGNIAVYATNPTHVVLDVNGYFAP